MFCIFRINQMTIRKWHVFTVKLKSRRYNADNKKMLIKILYIYIPSLRYTYHSTRQFRNTQNCSIFRSKASKTRKFESSISCFLSSVNFVLYICGYGWNFYDSYCSVIFVYVPNWAAFNRLLRWSTSPLLIYQNL